jgi:hypothetical protein
MREGVRAHHLPPSGADVEEQRGAALGAVLGGGGVCGSA